jgi:hypothetical protein
MSLPLLTFLRDNLYQKLTIDLSAQIYQLATREARKEETRMDYCDKPDEKDKNPDAKRHFKEIANGNDDAFAFCWTVWNFTHVIDDLVDRDRPVSIEDAAKWTVHLIVTLSVNPFYISNTISLLPHIVSMFNRWVDGDQWAKSDDKDKQSVSRVLRCGDIDMYLHVAYLIGGWDHMRAMSDARTYDSVNEGN